MGRVFASILTALVASLSGAHAVAPPTAKDLFSRTSYDSFSLSPDASRLAYVRSEGDLNDVYILNLASGESAPRLTHNYRRVTRLRWVNDDVLLVSVRAPLVFKRKNKHWRANLTEIYAIRSRLERQPIFNSRELAWAERPVANYVVSLLPDDPNHVLIQDWDAAAKTVNLYKVDVTDGTRAVYAEGSPTTYRWVMNCDNQPGLRLDLDDDRTEYTLYAWQDAPGEWVEKRRFEPDFADMSDEFWPVTSAGDCGTYYVFERAGEEEFRSLKRYDSRTGETSAVASDQIGADLSSVIFSGDSTSPIAVGFYKDKFELTSDHDQFAAHLSGLKEFAEGDALYLHSVDLADEKSVFSLEAPDDPGGVYLYDLAARDVRPLVSRAPALIDQPMGTAQAYDVTARDGLSLRTYVTHPVGVSPDAPAPLIIRPHGGPAVRDVMEFDAYNQYFATRGYRIVQPNFRGSTGFGRSFTQKGHGEWGGAMQDDITDVIKWAHQQGWASPDTTCVIGWSYGGYAALMAATTTSDLIACAVSTNGLTDLNAMVKHERKQFGQNSGTYRYIRGAIGDPKKDAALLRGRSPINRLSPDIAPILVLHGENDRRVPVSQATDFLKAAGRAKAPVELHVYDGLGHGGWSPQDLADQLRRVETFIDAAMSGAEE